MGQLSIIAYTKIIPLENAAITPDGYVVDNQGDVVFNAVCPIIDSSSDRNTGLMEGEIYQFETNRKYMFATEFQHSNFIELLADLAGYTPGKSESKSYFATHHTYGALLAGSGPFWELISAPKSQYTIGPIVAAKLADDFHSYLRKARALDTNLVLEGGFITQYKYWYEIFAAAAHDGMVSVY